MYKTIKTMTQALSEARAYRDPVVEDKGFSSQQIKMAYGILNDPRYKQGNYSGAVRAIDKIAKGLSNHPDVANALRRANESLKLESAASDKAKGMGLDYMSFGRYGKGGKVTHKNINGTLTAVDKDDKPVKEPEEKMPANVKKVFDDIKDFEITDNNAEQVEKLEKVKDDFEDAGKENYAAEIDSALEELMQDNVREADDILSDLKIKIKKTEVKEALDFDYAIVDRNNKIIKLYNAGDKIHYGNILDAKKNLEKEVPKNKTPLKLVTLAPGRSRNYKVGGTVLGIGEEVVTEDIYGKQDSKLMGTVTMVHNTSGKEVVVSNDPNAVKNQEKLGFKVQKEQKEETYQLSERDLLKLINKTGFSKADFKTNENDNDHSLNAIMLARAFGTSQEFKDMINIDKRHKERGSITQPDYQQRDALVKKYYPRLK